MKNKEIIQIKDYFQHSLNNNEKKYLLSFDNNIFPYSITKNDITSFNLILKGINKTKRKILNILYISNNNDKFKNKINLTKNWCKKQISLCFIYLYEYNDDYIIYDKLFYIITHYFKNNFILDNNGRYSLKENVNPDGIVGI